MTTLPVDPKRPQYFHLLWDEEIDRLREVLQTLQQREVEVLNRWYQLYTVHFGEAVTLSQREFSALYGHDLKQTVTHLLQGDMERFVMDLRTTGEELVERGVPFREVIACLHLFEESCSVVFDEIPWDKGPSERISMLLTFDKLSHCRMMVLTETYFGTTQARAQARTQALEREAARLAPDVHARQHFHGIVGHCPASRTCFNALVPLAWRVVPSSVWVRAALVKNWLRERSMKLVVVERLRSYQ